MLEHTYSPTIETERLILRQMCENDLDDFLEYFTDPVATRFLSGYKTSDKIGASILFRSNCMTKYNWAITLKTGDKSEEKVIGDVHFGNIVGDYLAYIGYILNRKYWGKGYATEAVSAAVNYGFEEMGLWRIRAITQMSNKKSQELLVRCGFSMEALIYDGEINGVIDNIYYYSKKRYEM